jgi:hypothetical protein
MQQEIPCALKNRAISRESVIAARFAVNERPIVIVLPVSQAWHQDDSTIGRVLQNQVLQMGNTIQNTSNFSLKFGPPSHLTKTHTFCTFVLIPNKLLKIKVKHSGVGTVSVPYP